MVAPSVEQLKQQFTDKYVAVDASRPELARFRGAVGQVKTVNMNGRALVQFLDYHLNTGWFDIDLGCLKVVDPPPKEETAKPEAKRPHDKPEGKAAPTAGDKQVKDAAAEKKKLSPLEMARMQGAGAAAKAPATKAEPKPAAEKPAAAKAASPAKGDRSKMSVADMLAAARANKPAADAETAPAAAAPPAKAPKTPAAKASPPDTPPTPAPPAVAPPAGGVVKVDRNSMSLADKIAYCRAKDSK